MGEFNNVDFSFRYGSRYAVANTPIQNGAINITTDSREVYIDINNIRLPINDIYVYNAESEIKALTNPIVDKLYFATDTLKLLIYNPYLLEWLDVTTDPQALNERITSIENIVDSITSFEILIVDRLPSTGESHIIYFVPNSDEASDALYEEFIWINRGGYFEKIGMSKADLTDYYTKSEANEVFVSKSDAVTAVTYDTTNNVFTKTIGDTTSEIVSASTILGLLTKSQIISLLGFTPAKLYYSSGNNEDGAITQKGTTELISSLNYIDNVSQSGNRLIFNVPNGDNITIYTQDTNTTYESMTEAEAKVGTSEIGRVISAKTLKAVTDKVVSNVASKEEINEVNAKLGNMKDSTDTGFVSVEDRLVTLETGASTAAIVEINAKLGNMKSSTDDDFTSVEDRLTAEETATSRIDGELGTLDSTATGYQTVAERLTTLETSDSSFDTRLDTDEDDIGEIKAKFGPYTSSTDIGFVSVEDRFSLNESNISELSAELGTLDSTESGYRTVADRLTDLETGSSSTEVIEINAKLGNMKASTDDEFVSVEDRLDLEESATSRIDAELGALDPTVTDYKTVAERLTTLETADTNFAAQIGSLDPTSTGYVTVANRLVNEETATARFDAELGTLDPTVTGYKTVAERLTTLETDTTDATDISEIQAQLGYPASTSTGFVSVGDRFTTDENSINRLNAAIGSVDPTETGYKTLVERIVYLEETIMTMQNTINELNSKALSISEPEE